MLKIHKYTQMFLLQSRCTSFKVMLLAFGFFSYKSLSLTHPHTVLSGMSSGDMTARSVNDDEVSEISHIHKSGGRKAPLISITALPEFANQSLEELRAEHYEKLLETGGV